MITPNLSGIDRMIRLSLGLFLLWLGLIAVDVLDDTTLNLIVACFGAVNLISAALSHCPLYKQAGISTLKPGSNPEVSHLRIQMVSIVSAMIMTVVVVFTMASWHVTEETVMKSAIAIYGNAINKDLNDVVELARSNPDEKRIQQSFQAYDNNNRFVVVRNEHNKLIYHTFGCLHD